jgi:LysM repeat protein
MRSLGKLGTYALEVLFVIELGLGFKCSNSYKPPPQSSEQAEQANPGHKSVTLDRHPAPDTTLYIVGKKESLDYIAGLYGIKVNDILRLNPQYIKNPGLIHPGDTLIIEVEHNCGGI